MLLGMRIFALIFVMLILVAGCSSPVKPDFSPTQPSVKIITYNINWGFVEPQNVVNYLAKTDADVVCLQETHQYWEVALKENLKGRYPYSVFYNEEAAGGIAVLSKYKLKNVKLLPPEAGWFPAMCGEVETPMGWVQFLNLHLRPPLSDRGSASVSALYRTPYIHRDEVAGFSAYIDPNRPAFITGDFNENEGDKAIGWLYDRGFTDSLSIYDTYTKTWQWQVCSGVRLSARYDHILFNEYLACTGARVNIVDASDHMPVFAVLVANNPQLSH